MAYVTVSFCCNDERGYFAGKVSAIHIGDVLMVDLQGTREPSFREDWKGRRVKVARRWFPVFHYQEWVGNWCHNGGLMDPKDAADLLNYLHGMKTVQVDGGYTELCDKWDSGQKFTAEDLTQ